MDWHSMVILGAYHGTGIGQERLEQQRKRITAARERPTSYALRSKQQWTGSRTG